MFSWETGCPLCSSLYVLLGLFSKMTDNVLIIGQLCVTYRKEIDGIVKIGRARKRIIRVARQFVVQ
jgi:hypothetical protein